MLVDYEYRNKKLLVSYVDDYGNIKLKYYNWPNPTMFVATKEDDPNRHGKYVTWDGKPVKQIYARYPNRYSVFDFMDELPKEEQETIFEYKEPNIFFIDIENEIIDKKPEPEKAESEIQTISIVNKDKILVLGTKRLPEKDIGSLQDDINNHFEHFHTDYKFMYRHYDSEYDMLLNFFKMVQKMSVLTGWNFIHYDWVFLVNRARRLGLDPTMASFTGVLRKAWDKDDHSEMPAHRIIVDYMELYAKWDTSVKVKESNSLNFVSENILDIKKVNYEGNLKYLYSNDYYRFVMYNAIDSALVQQIHIKMKYIDILYGIATLSRVKVIDAYNTLPVTEGILRRRMRDEKNIVFVKEDKESASSDMVVKGGWVKDPVVGMNTWTACFDFASLYPTTMREFNISADSYRGQLIRNDRSKKIEKIISEIRGEKTAAVAVFNGHKIEVESDDIVTLNGAVFKNEDGVVKKVMADIYKQRKKYKKLMMEANEELNELENELEKLKQEME